MPTKAAHVPAEVVADPHQLVVYGCMLRGLLHACADVLQGCRAVPLPAEARWHPVHQAFAFFLHIHRLALILLLQQSMAFAHAEQNHRQDCLPSLQAEPILNGKSRDVLTAGILKVCQSHTSSPDTGWKLMIDRSTTGQQHETGPPQQKLNRAVFFWSANTTAVP